MPKEMTPSLPDMTAEQDISFEQDTQNLGNYAANFVTSFFPFYSVSVEGALSAPQENSLTLLNTFTFYKICECTVYNVEDRLAYFADKMQKLFTTAYAIQQDVCYGIVSYAGETSLVLGMQPRSDNESIKAVIEGLLPGTKLQPFKNKFRNSVNDGRELDRYVGCIGGVPALKIKDKYLKHDLSPIMRSLNGRNYTVMVLCKPVSEEEIQQKLNEAIDIQDNCFAISKRTLSSQTGISSGATDAEDHHEANGEQLNEQRGHNTSGELGGAAAGAAAGAVAGSFIPGIGTALGAIGGGLIGMFVGKQSSYSKSTSSGTSRTITDGYSKAITETITKNQTISADIQNGYALELMKMSASVIERLEIGRSIGMWKSIVTFSSDSEAAAKIIQGSLYSEIASGIPEVLPPVVFSYRDDSARTKGLAHNQHLLIPKGFFDASCNSPLVSLVNSEELCGICTIPVEPTIGFQIKNEKGFSLHHERSESDKVLGDICEYERPLRNMSFGFSDNDLNKHTFVCGITGSGKTNTVKTILMATDKPFMVIEPAKHEYRNISKEITVYTIGRPEINCLKVNPFYVLPGISPQQHIDMLKDLFSASFAFYGPMPYIVEKCLYQIYTKRGWNLTLGFHPNLAGSTSKHEFFNQSQIHNRYSLESHKFLFPTMQDLKDEVDRYIENEMTYEGEVKGNIRSAIKARIDSLCIGSKGYIFNTHDVTDFSALFNSNVVLELEGLADDADKAFALGLLIIYINEFRQVQNDIDFNATAGLKHLLVLEEAHRLLKNVSTENNEDLGNPKGKAVEHFTNMLAEMRSYGQGVIVAEQIPVKLAPDVIKNSSNKIIHRIVAKDDQEVMANTVGISINDAICLGSLKTGYALCHKESMVQPVIVKVSKSASNNVLDKKLYDEHLDEKLFAIDKSILETNFSKEISDWSIKVFVSLLYQADAESLCDGVDVAAEEIWQKAESRKVSFVSKAAMHDLVADCITDKIILLMLSGVFSVGSLPENNVMKALNDCLRVPSSERIKDLTDMLRKYYRKEPKTKAIETVSWLYAEEILAGQDVTKKIADFCINQSRAFAEDVVKYIESKR